MSLAGHLWAVMHILCDGWWLFMNGLGGCSSSFEGFEGVQLSSFVGSRPCFMLWRVVIICGWLEWVLLVAGGLSWVMVRRLVHVERGKHATCEPNRCMNHT